MKSERKREKGKEREKDLEVVEAAGREFVVELVHLPSVKALQYTACATGCEARIPTT